MSKILKNNTASPVDIVDAGVTVPSSGQYTINPTEYQIFAESSDVIVLISDSTLTVNDGSFDLEISEGVDLIKGLFPKEIKILGSGGGNPSVTNGKLDVNATVSQGDSSFPDNQRDIFGNAITIQPNIIFSTAFSTSDHSDFLWCGKETGSGTVVHNPTEASMLLSTTTVSGDKAQYQTFRNFQYIPGQALDCVVTGVFAAPKTNVRQRKGLFSDTQSIHFEVDDTTINVVEVSNITGSAVEISRIPRVNWDDPLDGSGPSGLNIDFTKGQIFIIRYQWLGYGDIEYGIQSGNNFIPCHRISHKNVLDKPYTRYGSFHIRYEIENVGTTTSPTTLRQGCAAMKAYGSAFIGHSTSTASNKTDTITINSSTMTPLLSIRLSSAFLEGEITLEKLGIFSTSAADLYYEVWFNSTLTDPTWTADAGTISDADVGATALSGGFMFLSGHLNKSGSSNIADVKTFMRLGHDLDMNPNTITVAIKTFGGNAAAAASVIFKELR